MSKSRKTKTSIFFLLGLLFSLHPGAASSFSKTMIPDIKVLIGKSLKNIVVSGLDLKRDLISRGNSRQHLGLKSIRFTCPQFLLGKKQKTSSSGLLAQVSSPSGIVGWNDERYRGELIIAQFEEQEGCQLINRISLESYLNSLLGKEMNSSWPLEALKAQAVAARTYALYQIDLNKKFQRKGDKGFYDLENSERDQVNGSLADETSNTSLAVKQTKGEILVAGNQLGPIFYHSKCGGKTILPGQVWDKQVKGYRSVLCPFCKGHGSDTWTYRLSRKEFKNFIAKYARKISPKVSEVPLEGKPTILHPDRSDNLGLRVDMEGDVGVLNKVYLRRFLGRDKIRSNRFFVGQDDDQIVVTGEGNGHGVGMCQFGALDMADKGWNYKKILSYYFPDHTLVKNY